SSAMRHAFAREMWGMIWVSNEGAAMPGAQTIARLEAPHRRLVSDIILVLLCLLGATAFLYPFFLASPSAASDSAAHAADAPLFFVVLGPALLALLLAELGAGRLNAKTVAVLGVLMAINAVLRLPAGRATR